MARYSRRQTPKVVDGRVQKKNSDGITHNYYDHDNHEVFIDRRRPGTGHQHILRVEDIKKFIKLLPDWDELSKGLNAIVLDEAWDCAGWHTAGVVHVNAWHDDLWAVWKDDKFMEDHRGVFERLGVPMEETGGGYIICKFTEHTVRAYQLLHILLHELGHHHDRITTRRKAHTGRGESYAEEYALRYMDRIWDEYLKVFPLY